MTKDLVIPSTRANRQAVAILVVILVSVHYCKFGKCREDFIFAKIKVLRNDEITLPLTVLGKVSKVAKIRNRYNQVPHLTQDTNKKVTNLQLYTTNER